MDLGEMVASVVPPEKSGECPFKHTPQTHNKVNVVPPPKAKNNASTLSTNLDAESLHLVNISTTLPNGKPAIIQYTAHHLEPGNESWPKTKLYRWVDKRPGHIKGDIGYDVNSYRNGVDLPGHTGVSGWSSGSEQERTDFAFAAMEADGKRRQFHDRHPAYSDFVVQGLDKIAAKLDARPGGSSGCGKKNCPGNAKAAPFDPPYNILERIYGLAGKLATKLYGTPRNWKMPIMTSRFALMYKTRTMTEDKARDALNKDNFTY